MKAIGLILLGVILAAFSGNQLLTARADGASGLAALCFVGLVAGAVIALAWLISPCTENPINFRCMAPTTGAFHPCLWRKTKLGKTHWLVIGSYL